MMKLTFGEQVKIILSRKGMTIKELAELVERHTGKPMSRQNMTQRLGRDNFQEQDMRMIAEILGCHFTLNILETEEQDVIVETQEKEVLEQESIDAVDETVAERAKESESQEPESQEREMLRKGMKGYLKKATKEVAPETIPETLGEINPYTRKEYESNSVRMHPKRIGYVQVYDRELHKWTDMTEWAFLGYQERKKKLLGKDYKPPIYLD